MDFQHGFTMTIGGLPVAGESSFPVINPATTDCLAQAPEASRAQLDAAVAAARRAFDGWQAVPLAQRQALVHCIAGRLEAHHHAFARLLTSEQGKPLADAHAEVARCIRWLKETACMGLPDEVLLDTPEKKVVKRHVPLGVVAAIAPWNFPMTLAVWKIAPALVAGNTMVLKPSPFTPLTSLKLGELLRDLLPPGVLNVVSGTDRLGPWLTEHAGIDKIAFTGSTPTGRAIMRSASDTLKRVTLELGGNDPAIVFDDVDIDAWVPRIFWGAFANNAQFCLASKRMYVHASIYERFARALAAYARTVKIGDGMEPGTRIGPLQNARQHERIRSLLAQARADGVRFLAGGDVPPGRGYFVPVAIADDPPDDAPIVTEEAFGPVLPLLRFSSEDEVVRRANQGPYGLGASVWSADLERAERVARRLQAGTVWVNTIHELSPQYPLAGHKQSGLGRENGLEGLLEYTNTQIHTINRGAVALP